MKNLIYGTALIMIMAFSANTFAASRSFNKGEKAKTETSGKFEKKDDMKKGHGKTGSCCHHNKKSCHKK